MSVLTLVRAIRTFPTKNLLTLQNGSDARTFFFAMFLYLTHFPCFTAFLFTTAIKVRAKITFIIELTTTITIS
jgi:hypothetical protein